MSTAGAADGAADGHSVEDLTWPIFRPAQKGDPSSRNWAENAKFSLVVLG